MIWLGLPKTLADLVEMLGVLLIVVSLAMVWMPLGVFFGGVILVVVANLHMKAPMEGEEEADASTE